MSVATKVPTTSQTHQLVLYRRALHPESFQMKARTVVRHGTAELEAWLMNGAHLIRFRHDLFCACELVTDRETGLPTTGAVATFPCSGERDYEHAFTDAKVNYLTTVQTESLSAPLYNTTYDEMLTLADETDALTHKWVNSRGGACLSMLEINRYPGEIHAHSFHLQAQGGLVVRVESMFELKP